MRRIVEAASWAWSPALVGILLSCIDWYIMSQRTSHDFTWWLALVCGCICVACGPATFIIIYRDAD